MCTFIVLCVASLIGSSLMQIPDSSLCESSWTFHSPTATCIRMFTTPKKYSLAKHACREERGGFNKDFEGWLVGIHDAETDTFVRNLLGSHSKAFIGLFREGGNFSWLDKQPFTLDSYSRWNSGHPYQNMVYMTKTGWSTTYEDHQMSYFCQMYASFAIPNFECGSSEIGSKHPTLECSLSPHPSFGRFKSLTIEDSTDRRIVCDSESRCTSSVGGISGSLTSKDIQGKLLGKMNIDKIVNRADGRSNWYCRFEFSNVPSSFLLSSCKMGVYSAPDRVLCDYALRDNIEISCKVYGMYPEARSEWIHYVDNVVIKHWVINGQHTQYLLKNVQYYNSTFSRDIMDKVEIIDGNHRIETFTYPSIFTSYKLAVLNALTVRTVKFTTITPTDPPLFLDAHRATLAGGTLTVADGEEVQLKCKINGGNPEVFETTIRCDFVLREYNGRQFRTQVGNQVELKLSIRKDMDAKNCTCTGQHLSQKYKKSSVLTFDVQYPPQINSFTVNRNLESEVTLTERDPMIFQCEVNGNPKPYVEVYQHFEDERAPRVSLLNASESVVETKNVATCNASGHYRCTAKNFLISEPKQRDIEVKVRCKPKPCSNRENERMFSIMPGKDVKLDICVYAYPPPRDFKLVSEQAVLPSSSYTIKFHYTHPHESKGCIAVTIHKDESKVRDYSLQVYQSYWRYSWYDFSLLTYQTPPCPKLFTVTNYNSRNVSLSWVPSFDLGLEQVFILKVVKSKNDEGVNTVYEVVDSKQTEISHVVTHLSPGTLYDFQLNVKNKVGVTNCPQLLLNVSTPTSSSFQDDDDSVGTAVGITFVCIIVGALLIALFVFMRKKKREKKSMWMVFLSLWKRKDKKVLSKQESLKDTTPVGDVYAKVNKSNKKNTFYVTYQNQVILEKRKHSSNETPSWNDGHVSNPENAYGNLNQSSDSEICPYDDEHGKPSPEKNTQLKDQNNLDMTLVYTQVEIVPGNRRVEMTPVCNKNIIEDRVDYAAVDYLATAATAVEDGNDSNNSDDNNIDNGTCY